jgi:cell division protein FtsB
MPASRRFRICGAAAEPFGLRAVFRLFALLLIALLIVLQIRLHAGNGGLDDVDRLQQALEAQRLENEALRRRNAALEAEVEGLKQGEDAVEERARSELGMTRSDEIFYRVIETEPPKPGPPRQ